MTLNQALNLSCLQVQLWLYNKAPHHSPNHKSPSTTQSTLYVCLVCYMLHRIPQQRKFSLQYFTESVNIYFFKSFLGVLLCSWLTPASEAPLPWFPSSNVFLLLITANVLTIFKKAYYLGQGEPLSSVIVNVSTCDENFLLLLFHGLTTYPASATLNMKSCLHNVFMFISLKCCFLS